MKISSKLKVWMAAMVIIPTIAGLALVTHAQSTGTTASALVNEFFRRDKLRMNVKQAAVIRFMKDIKVSTANFEELEVFDAEGSFVYRTASDLYCFGNPSLLMLRCKNRIGIPTVALPGSDAVAAEVLVASLATSTAPKSTMIVEFLRRDQIQLSRELQAVLKFLAELAVPTENIIEIEVIDAEGRFIYNDRNDQVCLGSPSIFMIRCKNRMGLSTVTFQGDAD